MHKPVSTVLCTRLMVLTRVHLQVNLLTSNEQLNAASSLNLSHALHYALLCLPDKFSERELFTVSPNPLDSCNSCLGFQQSLYVVYPENRRYLVLGRFPHDLWREPEESAQHCRRQLDRVPSSVQAQAAGNLAWSNLHYAFTDFVGTKQDSPFISRSIHDSDTFVTIASQPETRHTVVASLPSNVRTILTSNGPLEERVVTKKQLQRAVASIVTRYSRSQSIKGIVTAGAVKTVAYVAQKLQRTYFSNKR